MKRVCIHQPDFAPYLGFFHRLLKVDLFIVLDDVQFVRRGWHHRDKIKTRNGETWLTLAIQKGDYHQKINEVTLSTDFQWITDNLNLIKESYKDAPFFGDYFPQIEEIYQKRHAKLYDINFDFLQFLFRIFALDVNTINSSALPHSGQKNELLTSLLQGVEATHYLSGIGARDYMEESKFKTVGIEVEWQKFKHPTYPQMHGNFIPFLSALDVIFNCGPEAKNILRNCDG